MIISYDPYLDWYEVSSEGVSHTKKVKGPDPDEIFDKTAPLTKYPVYYSLSKKKWMCPCEAYRFSNFEKWCKHIRSVIKYRLKYLRTTLYAEEPNQQKCGIQNDNC